MRKNSHSMRWLTYIIISLAAILSYSPTFTGEFILDDKPLIEQNQYITNLHSLQSYLTQEDGASDKSDPEEYHTGYYRPLINLSYWLDYKIWGMWAPGFRTTNLILHILCSLALYHFLFLLTKNRGFAIWPALIFAVHPVNTEAVSWVTSRNNILATLFALLAHCAYIRAQEKKSRRLPFILLSTLFFGGAVFSKEFGVMLLPILFLHRVLIIKRKFRLTEEAVQLLPFILFLIFYFILRQKATSSWLSPEGLNSIWTSIYFTPYLIASNLKMILLPFNLHSFVVKYPEAYLNWQIGFGFSVFLLMAFFVYRFRENRLAVFGACSFLVALFPILNIVPTSGISLFSMRWLYFPMAFLAPAFAALLKRPLRRNKSLTIAVLTVLTLYFGTYSMFLNKALWHDEETFFETEIRVFNNTYYAYGCALKQLHLEDHQEAEKYFRIAVNGYHSSRSKTQIDYAAFLNDMGRPGEALFYLEKANSPRLWPKEKEEWYRNMGAAFFQLNRAEEALPYFKLAVAYGPNESVNWANLGAVFGVMEMYAESVNALTKGLEIDYESIQLRKNLAKSYMGMKKYEKAIEVLSEIHPDDVEKNTGIRILIKNAEEGLAERDS